MGNSSGNEQYVLQEAGEQRGASELKGVYSRDCT